MEHLIIQELKAYLGYSHSEKQLTYWHTLDNKYEVDAIIGNAEYAIEVKSSNNASSSDTKGLKAFGEEHPNAKLILISMDEYPKMMNGIEVWPARQFLERLWENRMIKK
jgi:predicted AAA+ superfamily ATPase